MSKSPSFEITLFNKAGGPLTKRISFAPDGKLMCDGSACVMSHGTAERVKVTSVGEFATLIGTLRPNQAIALGALRAGLPNKVDVVTEKSSTALSGRTSSPAPALTSPIRAGVCAVGLRHQGDAARRCGKDKETWRLWPTLVSELPVLGNLINLRIMAYCAFDLRATVWTGAELRDAGLCGQEEAHEARRVSS